VEFVEIPEREVWQQWGAQAGRERVNLYPTSVPTTWWGFRNREGGLLAVYGLATLKRGGQRLRGVYVSPLARGRGFGPACVRDAMERAGRPLDTLDYDAEPYLSLGWTQKGWRADLFHMVLGS